MNCCDCDNEQNAPNGICSKKKASDGLPLRCVGEWSKDKHYYLQRYIDIFTTAMKNKWDLCYIDLFTGPGKCKIRETEKEIDGSPLISLKFPFKKYIFAELDQSVLASLQKRCKSNQDNVKFIQGDCNNNINEIVENIPSGALSLVFIDPTGLDINFDTICKLTENKQIDLIINFPEGMAIRRNLRRFIESSHCKLDDFIGDTQWRNLFNQETKFDEVKATRKIMDYYRNKLNVIGYTETKTGEEIYTIKSSTNSPLYLLLFASKHALGSVFWNKIGKIEPSGQRKLW